MSAHVAQPYDEERFFFNNSQLYEPPQLVTSLLRARWIAADVRKRHTSMQVERAKGESK